MHLTPVLRALLSVCVVSASACKSATAPTATLTLSTPADFSATVSKIEFESAIGPAGPYSQHDVWVIIPPATAANAGVVVPKSTPVFRRSSRGRITSASPSDIKVGDSIDVWHDFRTAYGAVQGPPGAPTYIGTQIVIAGR